MWWLQLLFFSLGVLVPVVLARWLEERFYEHHDLPGKSSFQRVKFAIEVLVGNEAMPETGFMKLKDRPISLNLKMVSGAVVVVSWFCVFIGLYFFEGLGAAMDHWAWRIPVYFLFIGAAVVFLRAVITAAIEEPSGDLTEFPNVVTYIHLTSVGAVFFIFSVGGLFASDFLQWTQDLAVDLAPLVIVMGLGFLFLGGFSAWKAFHEEKRATSISHRLSLIETTDLRRQYNLQALRHRLQQEAVAPAFIDTVEGAIEQHYNEKRQGIVRGMNNEELPALKTVKETTSTKVPTFREVLMNYWVPLGQPKLNGEFGPWERFLLNDAIVNGTGAPKANQKRLRKLQKRVVNPIKAEFELQYTLVESIEEAKVLVDLYEKYADFPGVVERVLAGEDEEFVLIDLGLFQD